MPEKEIPVGKIIFILKYIWAAWKAASTAHKKYKDNVEKGMSEIEALADALPKKD